MILDRLEQCPRYLDLHPGFAPAFEYLRALDPADPEFGRFELDGERLIVIIEKGTPRTQSGARLEVHRRYMDIQLTLPPPNGHGVEIIGWRPLSECRALEATYDEQRDIEFFADTPRTWLTIPPATFSIFFPTDAHAPLAGEEEVLKAIVKVACHWS
ncbi:MAG: YhcH/YjgK/YiaL family protein [Planctomycetota bacterium]|nr:YhcH/YjgK/YiaL family protein [Planctomycetota bacterium]